MRNAHSVVPRARLIDLTNTQGDGDRSNRIDVYVRRLRKKIEAAPDQPDFIHTVRGLGYTFRDDQADTTKAAG
jgi:DNA-binding response OmpR family regulator